MNILPLLDRPIAFQRSFIRLDIGVTAALFLSQMIYWTNRSDDDGWVYKTQEEWKKKLAFPAMNRRAHARNFAQLVYYRKKRKVYLLGFSTRLIMMFYFKLL